MWSNQSAAANRRPAGQSDGLDNLSAIVAADRAFPAAVAELGSLIWLESVKQAVLLRSENSFHFRWLCSVTELSQRQEHFRSCGYQC